MFTIMKRRVVFAVSVKLLNQFDSDLETIVREVYYMWLRVF